MTAEDYTKCEEKFFNSLMKYESGNVLFYCVTGSLARKDIIVGWSDIDVILVVKNYSLNWFKNLKKAIIQTNYSLKIGTTTYSLEEFNHSDMKIPNTYISMSLVRNGVYTPRIHDEQVILPFVDNKKLLKMDLFDIPKFTHAIKRELLEGSNMDEKKVYKTSISLMKIFLKKKGISTYGYKETIDNFKKEFGLEKNLLEYPEVILSGNTTQEKRMSNYITFLNWVRINLNLV
jgi:hypothetical protein